METLLQEKKNVPYIALRIGKNKTTIYRCISNNSDEDGVFRAESAWKKIGERHIRANSHPRIISDSILATFIIEKIKTSWSPEQIAGRWKVEHWEPLSHQTIYDFVRNYPGKIAKIYLRRKEKPYRNRKQEKKDEKYQLKDRRIIDDRPKEIEERKEIGHWEGDTIIGKDHQGAIVTNVERKSGCLIAWLVPKKTGEAILETTKELFEDLPEEFRLSITYDNGREFALHKDIEKECGLTVYFAHAYSPWERGTNENTNGLLREFIPKWTDFTTVTKKKLQYYVDLINNRPRKRLWFKTPYEVMQEELKSCIWL